MRTVKKVQVILYKNPKQPEFLLLLTDKGENSFWQGVTGAVEDTDVSIKSAAIREISEELSIFLDEDKLIGPLYQYKFKTTKPDSFEMEIEEFCFTSEVPENIVFKLSKEHKTFKWLSFEEAIKTIAHESPKIFLQKIKDYL